VSLGKRLFDVVRANSLQARTGREKNFADVEPVYTDAWLAAEVQDPDPTPDEVFTAQELQWFR
jgi:hypothetical protein